MIKRNKKILYSFIACSLLIAVAWIFFCNFIIKSRTISPDKKYEVSYNCSSKKVTLVNLNDNVKTYIVYGDDPVFLWSPDSKLLAVTYNTKNGNRWTQIAILENSTLFLNHLTRAKLIYAIKMNGIRRIYYDFIG